MKTITLDTIKAMNVGTFSVQDNSPRGVKTVTAEEIKPGDRVVIDNHFCEVVAAPEQDQDTTPTAEQEQAEQQDTTAEAPENGGRSAKTISEWIEFEKQYKAAFKRCNISGAKIYELQELEAAGQLRITVTRERFTRTAPAKHWSRTPISSESEQVTAEYYANYISGLDFFGGRVVLNHTSRGYIAVDFSCTSPDGCIKSEAHFSFEEVRA